MTNQTKMFMFTEVGGSAFVRRGRLTTRRGVVQTPAFMPVGTRGAVKSLLPVQVAATGAEIILANTYHLHLQPGENVIASLGGLHDFTRWPGPILTDSGGFQVFSLAHARKITEEGVHFKDPKTGDKVFISPEISMQIQLQLGSDIIMAFDDLTGLDGDSRSREEEAFHRTHRWLERSINEFKRLTRYMPVHRRPLLFGIAQGGLSKDLRAKSLEIVQSTDVDGIAIGGLSVGESRADMHAILDFLAPRYDPSRPHYLMGVGDPIDFRHAIERGIDMMDCVLPTRNARHATAWIYQPCTCAGKAGQADPPGASRRAFDLSPLRSTLSVSKAQLTGGPQTKTESRVECTDCDAGDKKIHLTNLKYAQDSSVIEEGCDCYACAGGFTKGFLRHQFKMGESLAGTLVSMHNLRYLARISQSYQGRAQLPDEK